VTLRELIDEAGRDAVRFFLVSRKADSEFVFDIDLARSQSEENPVYYVQYAHARVASRCRPCCAREPLRDAAVAPPGRFSGRGGACRARIRAASAHVLPQGF